MLEDPEIVASGLLKWSADGQGFVCSDPNEFARLFLSKYFKHANWHSFVRQLNMYGFNKQVNDVFQTLSQPADQPVAWEFRHSIFRRGDPTCVQRIKRRSVKSNSTAHRDLASSQIARPAGLPTATPITPVVYQSPYQPVSYASDAASHSVMALPRYSGGDPYAMSGGYPPVVGGSSASAPSHGWMSNPNSQYLNRPPPYPSNAYMPSEGGQTSSQRGSSTLPSRTTESYTRHDRPGRPY
ncbi:Flocculation suppression protein [Naganishia albida]|nr:Flocculation suppression protein [Naganishia albida]